MISYTYKKGPFSHLKKLPLTRSSFLYNTLLRLSKKNFENVYCCPKNFCPIFFNNFPKKPTKPKIAQKIIKPNNHGFEFKNEKNRTKSSSSILGLVLDKNQTEKNLISKTKPKKT